MHGLNVAEAGGTREWECVCILSVTAQKVKGHFKTKLSRNHVEGSSITFFKKQELKFLLCQLNCNIAHSRVRTLFAMFSLLFEKF